MKPHCDISDKDTDAESQTSEQSPATRLHSMSVSWADDSEECPSETEEKVEPPRQTSIQEQLERMARENLRLLQENALLRTSQQQAVPAPGSQWLQMSFQVPLFMLPGVETQALPAKVEGPASRRRRQRAKGKAVRVESEAVQVAFDVEDKPSDEETRTTVMLRNLPRDFSRDMLCELLDSQGFTAKYDFVYMPIDFVRKASLGYAFVNLVSVDVVSEFWNAFDGFKAWSITSPKVCRVSWSNPHQGLEDHVNRYKNSPLMHRNVPDECRPILLQSGVRVDFPPATKSLRAPRLRASRQRCPFWNSETAEVEAGETESDDEVVMGEAFKTFDVFA